MSKKFPKSTSYGGDVTSSPLYQVGPWAKTYIDNRTKFASGWYANYPVGGTPNWTLLTNVTDRSSFGIFASRSGYFSPRGDHRTVRNASLTRTVHHTLARASSTWRYPALDWILANRDFNCHLGKLTDIGSIITNQTQLNQNAAAKFYKHAQSDMSLLTIIGEARESGRMIASNARSIATGIEKAYSTPPKALISDLKKARLNANSTSIINTLSDYWLEVQFGLKPLVNDIAMGMVALDDLAYLTNVKSVGKVSYDQQKSFTAPYDAVSNTWESVGSSNWFKVNLSYRLHERFDTKYGGSFTPTPGVGTYSALSTSWSDVLPAAWELFPESFLVDYFSNVGDKLYSHTFDFTVWSNLYHTTYLEQVIDYTFTPIAAGAYTQLIDITAGAGRFEAVTFQRVAGAVAPPLDFQLRAPSLAQSANLVALAGSRVTNAYKVFHKVIW